MWWDGTEQANEVVPGACKSFSFLYEIKENQTKVIENVKKNTEDCQAT